MSLDPPDYLPLALAPSGEKMLYAEKRTYLGEVITFNTVTNEFKGELTGYVDP